MSIWTIAPFETLPGAAGSSVPLLLAYLDPGTGSYALQILLATLFGGMFALKQSWAELKTWFTLRFGNQSAPGDTRPIRRGVETGIGVRPSDIARQGAHGQSTAKIR